MAESSGCLLKGIQAARSLDPGDWCLLGESWLRLLFVSVLLRARRVPRLPLARDPSGSGDARARNTIERIGRIVRLASFPQPLPARCLARSLVLYGMLRRRGIRTEFKVGVRSVEGALSAHAWLEYGGSAVLEPAAVETAFLPLVPGGMAR